jgi:hypothetical protein
LSPFSSFTFSTLSSALFLSDSHTPLQIFLHFLIVLLDCIVTYLDAFTAHSSSQGITLDRSLSQL